MLLCSVYFERYPIRFDTSVQSLAWIHIEGGENGYGLYARRRQGVGSRDPSLRTPGRPGAMNPLTPPDSREDSELNPAGTSYFREPQTPTDRLRGGFTAT